MLDNNYSKKGYGTAIIAILFACISLVACNAKGQDTRSPQGYDFSQGDKFSMPESLLEISGIAFHKGNSDTVYAIQDEQGKLFRLAWDKKKQWNSKFGKSGDYEDLTIIKDMVIVLKSNGTLFTSRFADATYNEIDSVREWKDLLPKGEYEGIWGDEATGKLYILCKNCKDEDNKEMVKGYILQFADSITASGSFQLDINELRALAGKIKRGFRPSALAKNPVTNDWFIVSAVNKLLVVTDANWKVKEAIPLSSNLFNQPEGIAFDTPGNLYISNEGDDLSAGNIIKFLRLKK